MNRPPGAQMLQCEARPLGMERRWKSNVELAPNCPRCASSNTKFCYYNNYSLSQPRYFCKGCRRYWTKGGSLRNVPVGGGCRRSRRSKATVRSTVLSVGGSISPSLPTSENPSSMVPPSGSEGSDIDLAAVFSKFLDQGSSIGNTEPVGSLEVPFSSNQDTHLEDVMVECQTRSSVTQLAGLPQIQLEEEQIPEFVCHDPNPDLFGLPTMISDELGQDLLWSDPNFDCEPAVQLEEFGSFSSDDQLKNIPASLVSDNWSLLDLPFL